MVTRGEHFLVGNFYIQSFPQVVIEYRQDCSEFVGSELSKW